MREPTIDPVQPVTPAGAAPTELDAREPRWPAVLAILATAALHYLLPEPLRFGPGWLMLVATGILLIPTALAHRYGRYDANRLFSHIVGGILTASMIWSLGLLIERLPSHRESPQDLLRAAVTLWIVNILVFAAWYWRLDAGGPNVRDQRKNHVDGAFLFPQMVLSGKSARAWRPGFVDYLFLAFNTSTAFSPTDVPVLSRWAKMMMMMQALISLVTVAIVAARAVNIL